MENLFVGTICFTVGCIAGFFIKKVLGTEDLSLKKEIDMLRAQLNVKEEELNAKNKEIIELNKLAAASARELETIKNLKEQFLKEQENVFKAVSSEALSSNNKSFLELAKSTLEKYQQNATNDLETRQKAIDNMVLPVKDILNKFEVKIGDLEKERQGAYEGLTSQVAGLMRQTQTLSNALSSSSVRGRWGELQLKKIVELAGMLNYCDFVEQATISIPGEDKKLRPDMIIRLPGGSNIVVDSKAPVSKFIEAVEINDAPQRQQKMKEFAAQIRSHIKTLSSKDYWKQLKATPDFVVLFMPGEAYFSAALEADPALIEDGVQEKVIIATPTTLISLLKAAAYGWRSRAVEQNALDIKKLGIELYDRIFTMTEHFCKLGNSLGGAVEYYNKTISSYESRVLVSARRFKELEVSDKELPNLPEKTIENTTKKLYIDIENKEEV
ncbi:MAG: DNA recombination protein RmuC [Syntrophomonadaceae bacterium]|jgi:DNA recombination protein RmuC|nr:DNA recombination protein RmuC [Syntrophomonadaceae bacterium]